MVRRQDQRQTGVSRAGSGPAPSQQPLVNPIIIVTPGKGVFIYAGTPGPGNLIGSWTAQAGTDPYGNAFPKGINVTSGVLSGVVIDALSEMLNPGPLFLDASAGQTISVFTAAGVNNWTAPAGVTAVDVYCWAAGGGGDGGDAAAPENGGGGGAFSLVTSVAVTPATVYHPTVGTGGAANTAGGNTTFAGDVVTVTANGGGGAVDPNPGAGGAASTTPAGVSSFAGGKGGIIAGGGATGGAGGGGAAGQLSAGNPGMQGSGAGGGAGGAAGAGFLFPSGAGGAGGAAGANGGAGVAPGGGGGGAGLGGATVAGSGANGQVVLIYSTGTLHTIAAIAGSTVTDPATNFTANIGITSIDPIFGDTANFNGANVNVNTTWMLHGGSFDVGDVGQGLRVIEGANAKQGTATLAAGTILVANTTVTANSRIFLTAQTTGAGPGALRVSARVVGTSFTITSSNAADTSVVAWEIFEPG